jgi:hypothetical protein
MRPKVRKLGKLGVLLYVLVAAGLGSAFAVVNSAPVQAGQCGYYCAFDHCQYSGISGQQCIVTGSFSCYTTAC